jgi:putative salt-induced outer membrane protein YdiY
MKYLLLAAALAFASGESRAQAQDEAIPDSVAVDVGGSKTTSTTEATFVKAPDAADLAKADAEAKKEKAAVDWSLSAGGAINTGNTQSWMLNAGTSFLLTKTDHRLVIDSMFNYGRANANVLDPDSIYSTVSRQWFFASRYEYFFTEMDAVWGALGFRWDPFAGLNLQMLANAGYLRAFIKEEKQLFTGRIGYSYTYENYTDQAVTAGNAFLPTANIHGLLLALDYENRLNEHVELLSSITYIGNINEVPAQNAKSFQDNRIYWTIALLSQLSDKFAIEARFLLLYDQQPAGLYKTDTTTLFSLVYTPFKSKEE